MLYVTKPSHLFTRCLPGFSEEKGRGIGCSWAADGTRAGQGWDQTLAETEKWQGIKCMGFASISGPALSKSDVYW